MTKETELKLEQVSMKYIPILDKEIEEGYAQLTKNREKRIMREKRIRLITPNRQLGQCHK